MAAGFRIQLSKDTHVGFDYRIVEGNDFEFQGRDLGASHDMFRFNVGFDF